MAEARRRDKCYFSSVVGKLTESQSNNEGSFNFSKTKESIYWALRRVQAVKFEKKNGRDKVKFNTSKLSEAHLHAPTLVTSTPTGDDYSQIELRDELKEYTVSIIPKPEESQSNLERPPRASSLLLVPSCPVYKLSAPSGNLKSDYTIEDVDVLGKITISTSSNRGTWN